jgi:hypothetical protein
MKVLEFTLPSEAAGTTRGSILKEIKRLSDQHGFKYTSKTRGYKLYVRVNNITVTLLALEWKPKTSWHCYSILDGWPPGL